MLKELELPTLQDRRRHQRLTFLYKVVEGHVPAINIEHYLKSQRVKRTIRAKQFEDYTHTNIVLKSVNNNSKCFDTIFAKSDNFKHSFFPRTVLDWNKLCDSVVKADTIQGFKTLVATSDN